MSVVSPDAQQFLACYNGDIDKAIAALKQAARQPKRPVIQRTYGAPIVQMDDVRKSYKVGKTTIAALNGLTLHIREGEFVALTGPSGSGKSTALQLIGGLDKPTRGTIEVAGTDISALCDARLSTFRNTTIGFVFQFFYLQPFLTLATNVEVPAMFAGTKRDLRRQRTDELLSQVGLADRAQHLPKELSGGQMQRAAIARALLNKPKLLLADEPTGNLDSVNGQAIMDLFDQIRAEHGTTIIMVTHDPAIAARADREITLKDGVLA